jgi:hypothetical protein
MADENTGKIESQWNEIDQLLNDYDERLCLKHITHSPEVEKILTISYVELKALSAERCGECAVLLAQYGIFVQKEINRQTAKMKWAEKGIHIMAAKYGKNYSQYMKFEEKQATIISDNSAAFKLHKLKQISQAIVDELSYITSRINTMGQSFIELQNTKRRTQ